MPKSRSSLPEYIKNKVLADFFSPYLYFQPDAWRKYFSLYILLTDQISLPDRFHFLRHWVICVLELFAVKSMTS